MERIMTVAESRFIAPGVCLMRLSGGKRGDIKAPGQFINIKIDGFFLRRPISVCDDEDGGLTIIFKTVGDGTRALAALGPGAKLDVLSGLGNGYDISVGCRMPLLLGGGAGVPPMYLLAKKLIEAGKHPTVILGFNTAAEIFLRREFEALGIPVIVATADGSEGVKGFVTDAAAKAEYDYTFACGPEPMLRAVYDMTDRPGQFSFERRMGCGFGACMGCSCRTVTGCKRICVEGPVLFREEIIW